MEVVEEEKKEKSVVEVELEVKQVQRAMEPRKWSLVQLAAVHCRTMQASTIEVLCTTVGGEGLGASAARRTGGRIVLLAAAVQCSAVSLNKVLEDLRVLQNYGVQHHGTAGCGCRSAGRKERPWRGRQGRVAL